MGITKVTDVRLKEQDIYRVTDRIEDELFNLSKKGAIEFKDLTARGLALAMTIVMIDESERAKKNANTSN